MALPYHSTESRRILRRVNRSKKHLSVVSKPGPATLRRRIPSCAHRSSEGRLLKPKYSRQRLDAIGQITSGVAHDFNNLLTVVQSNTSLLSRNVSAPADQEGLDLISGALQRGIDLTTRLIAFSRKQRLEPQEIDLNRQITGMDRLLRAALGGTVRLRTTLDPKLWVALVDPSHLESIILNLAINARDAMPSGGILTIETFNATIERETQAPHEPAPGQYAGLSVIDAGTGIPDDVLPHIFEPFFTTKEPGKGSGLGLAQVFGFAKQSAGGVSIETCVGQGTAVSVYLPRRTSSVIKPARRERDQKRQGTRNWRPRLGG
jgi:signal transduction histidine kinase